LSGDRDTSDNNIHLSIPPQVRNSRGSEMLYCQLIKQVNQQ